MKPLTKHQRPLLLKLRVACGALLFVPSNHPPEPLSRHCKTLIFSIPVVMEGRLPGFNTQLQHNQVYFTPSSNYTNIPIQAVKGPVDTREAIRRELEKEMIREKIIAEEVQRFRLLEAEMRSDPMSGRGFPSSFMLGPQSAEINGIAASLPNAGPPTLFGADRKPPPPSIPGDESLMKK